LKTRNSDLEEAAGERRQRKLWTRRKKCKGKCGVCRACKESGYPPTTTLNNEIGGSKGNGGNHSGGKGQGVMFTL